MKVLIGSQALKFHNMLFSRIPADYDFINDIKIENAEVLSFDEPSNKEIYDYCQIQNYPIIDTPFGKAFVPSLDVLKAIKIGSLPINKYKHSYDLSFLTHISMNEFLTNISKKRTVETINRIKKQKFFNNANFPRIIEHDLIHSYVALEPMYKKILKDNSQYEGDVNKFNNLNYNEKRSLLFEEVLVFGIERDLLPKIKACPSLIHHFVNDFKNVSKSSDASLYWFFKFAQPHGVHGTPLWQTNWIQENQQQLLNELPEYWNNSINYLSEEFWDLVIKYTFKGNYEEKTK